MRLAYAPRSYGTTSVSPASTRDVLEAARPASSAATCAQDRLGARAQVRRADPELDRAVLVDHHDGIGRFRASRVRGRGVELRRHADARDRPLRRLAAGRLLRFSHPIIAAPGRQAQPAARCSGRGAGQCRVARARMALRLGAARSGRCRALRRSRPSAFRGRSTPAARRSPGRRRRSARWCTRTALRCARSGSGAANRAPPSPTQVMPGPCEP